MELKKWLKKEQVKFWGTPNICATSFSKSNFAFKRFMECLVNDKGILESTTSVDIHILVPAIIQGKSITSNIS